MAQGFGTPHGRRNTLATQTREDKDFIHMGEGNTGENNQGLGMTSDPGHKASDLKREESYFSK